MPENVTCKIRILVGRGIGMGPGKAELLTAIRETRSINAAAKRLGMSYRRAWQLVEETNALFKSPLVTTSRGGKGGGGAMVTALGLRILKNYQNLTLMAARSPEFRSIARHLAKTATGTRQRPTR